jgi:hypothetical protein
VDLEHTFSLFLYGREGGELIPNSVDLVHTRLTKWKIRPQERLAGRRIDLHPGAQGERKGSGSWRRRRPDRGSSRDGGPPAAALLCRSTTSGSATKREVRGVTE